MKRSMMLELMMEEIIHIEDLDDVSKLLDKMEKAGMLPPYGSKIKQVDIIDRWGQNTGKSERVRVIETEWDEE